MSDKVICCFCGKTLPLEEATILTIQPNIKSGEKQNLFCHKNHLMERLIKSIPLHPDLFDDDDK
ncbi:MAG TPA: hypothetical protein PLH27_00830 [bacterium]|nr:hypothetical protein [bacterium]HMY34966.1 hypothetical protein [bacterium]HMZ03463.1 hypothetical protein [bacterium]HNB08010.1 hypothetical protein [bacterium]HNC47502.1 hypothetical protein [bacterium]